MAKVAINNEFYHDLGSTWWEGQDHMITFLRYESVIKLDFIRQHLPVATTPLRILDLGSGGGLITLPLAMDGHQVTAVDQSGASLSVLMEQAKIQGCDHNITVLEADLHDPLPLAADYDVVLAMDVLEHLDNPQRVLANAIACLEPDGVFMYHTLNQTFLCWLIYLQIAPRLIRHSPKNLHRHEYNIPHRRLLTWLADLGMAPHKPVGIHAPLFQKATWDLLTQRRLTTPLRFEYIKSLAFGYLGCVHRLI